MVGKSRSSVPDLTSPDGESLTLSGNGGGFIEEMSRPPTPHGMNPRGLAKTHKRRSRPAFDCIALLLQGGGALGAYQAGVYEALAEAGLAPDWVVGISIGSINAAIIAGNPPESRVARLRTFWEGVTRSPFGLNGDVGFRIALGDTARAFVNHVSAAAALTAGAPGFFKPRIPNPWFQPPGA